MIGSRSKTGSKGCYCLLVRLRMFFYKILYRMFPKVNKTKRSNAASIFKRLIGDDFHF